MEIDKIRQFHEQQPVGFYKNRQLSGTFIVIRRIYLPFWLIYWGLLVSLDVWNLINLAQLETNSYPEHSTDFLSWKQWKEKASNELRQTVSQACLQTNKIEDYNKCFFIYSTTVWNCRHLI